MARPKRVPKSPNGRPPHAPTERTRAQVEMLALRGATMTEIARLVGIAETTLRKHYRPEMELGEAKGDQEIRRTMFEVATREKNATLLMFLAKTRLKMTEKQDVNINLKRSGDDLTDEELLAIARRGRDRLEEEGLDGFEPDGPAH